MKYIIWKYFITAKHTWRPWVLALCIFLGNGLYPGNGLCSDPSEYQIKAVFLYNLTNFVFWPDDAFSDPSQPFTVGVIGRNPFGNILEKVMNSEKVGHRDILVKYYANIHELLAHPCQMVFADGSIDTQLIHDIADAAKKHHILTVGDDSEFLQQGGMMALLKRKGRIQIAVNPLATQAAGLDVSAKLLNMVKIVTP